MFKLLYGLHDEAYCSLLTKSDLNLFSNYLEKKELNSINNVIEILESYKKFDVSIQYLQKIPSIDSLLEVFI